MSLKGILTEDSVKAVLEQIAHDIHDKVSATDLDEYFSMYLANSGTTDLTEAVVNIINENIDTIDLSSILPSVQPDLDLGKDIDFTSSDWLSPTEVIDDPNKVITPFEPISPNLAKLNLNGLSTEGLSDVGEIHKNRKLIFMDDFEGDALDNDFFLTYNSVQGDTKMAVNTKDNVTVSDSVLHIAGRKEDYNYNGTTYNYTTGVVQSRLHFEHCLFESKMRFKKRTNWRNAYWTCGFNVTGLWNWALCGEIDFFENDGAQNYTTFHYSSGYAHQVTMPTTTVDSKVQANFKNSGDEEWHIFGCELSEGRVKFYFDGQLYAEARTDEVTYSDGVNPFDHWQHWIWSLYPLNKNADEDIYIDVDWVRAWTLENKATEDITPHSVTLSYLGTSNRVEANNKMQVGVTAQLYPIYSPSDVIVASNTTEKTTFTLECDNDVAVTNGGAIRFNNVGTATLTYKDVFGTTVSQTFEGYEADIPLNGEVNLEDWDVKTAEARYGRYATTYSVGKLWTETQKSFEKSLHWGVYKVEPSTTYNFTRANSYSNESVYVTELDASGKILGTTIFKNATDSFTTKANTVNVLLQGYLQDSTVQNDLIRVRSVIRNNFIPKFTKEAN